ncbi:hypothetical protein RhoFasB10_05079 [Rhodococcus sp. B10]|nr:hypothetical protein [Rhodococcus sp. B10]
MWPCQFEVPELPVACLSQSGVEGIEHPGQFESLQRGSQRRVSMVVAGSSESSVVAQLHDRMLFIL